MGYSTRSEELKILNITALFWAVFCYKLDMKKNKFTERISGKKLRNEIHQTYIKEVEPFLEANRKAYKEHLKKGENY